MRNLIQMVLFRFQIGELKLFTRFEVQKKHICGNIQKCIAQLNNINTLRS